jgi:NTP pyrophosphatase (non-canonical NTP hydrolase)
MKANEYQEWTEKTAIYPKNAGLAYTIIGLASEVGEIAGKYKKCIRDDGSILTEERKEQLLDELGDVLWYAARIAAELRTSLEDVLQRNHDKLEDRLARDVIKGSGDNR